MWQSENESPEGNSAVGGFAAFLESPMYLAWAKSQTECEQHSVTLADAIQGWLEDGDGIGRFGTYTSFLLGVMEIIDEWTSSGRGKNIVDAYVDPINKRAVSLFQVLETSDPTDGPFYSAFRFVGTTAFHPIMQQNWFEKQRVRAARTT